MNDGFHIFNEIDKPDISAEEAWNSMSRLLDEEMPIMQPSQKSNFITSYNGIALVVTIIAIVSLYFGYVGIIITNHQSQSSVSHSVSKKFFLSRSNLNHYSKEITEGTPIRVTDKIKSKKSSFNIHPLCGFAKCKIYAPVLFKKSNDVLGMYKKESKKTSIVVANKTSIAPESPLLMNAENCIASTNSHQDRSSFESAPSVKYSENSKDSILSESFEINKNEYNSEHNSHYKRLIAGDNNTSSFLTSNNPKARNMARKGKAKEQNTFHVGLEWPVAFPLGEKEYYWYTASGRKQPYVSFIPSIWISKALNENVEILLDVAPFSQITGKHNTFTTTGTINASDSMATGQTTTMLQLVKVQSCHLALSMGYCFSDQWQIRLGIGGSRIYKALFKEETYNDQTGDLQSSELISVRSGDSRMSKMHLWQMDANASIAYKWNWIEAGVELRVPLTKLSYSLFIQPFAANLYFRFRLK